MATLYAGMLTRLERDFVWGVCFLNLDTRRLLMTNSTFRHLHLSCKLYLTLPHSVSEYDLSGYTYSYSFLRRRQD